MADLLSSERLYYRDQFRAARYAALANAEGFYEICFALEALGLRLLGKKADMGKYLKSIGDFAIGSVVLNHLSSSFPGMFGKFASLYDQVRVARNDAMHTGVYARHATTAAIELCIGLEEAIMNTPQQHRKLVEDYMVKGPVLLECWQPVAYARQLMLTHSFSFLPIFQDSWKLLSEVAMARYIQSDVNWAKRLAANINEASKNGLELLPAPIVRLKDDIKELLNAGTTTEPHTLWLVQDDKDRLCGVLSPFELM